MIYIVSGYRRSGTSMMAYALRAGGLHCFMSARMEKLNIEHKGYTPNPSGLSEVGQSKYMKTEFLRMIPDGCLVKILFDGLPCLPSGEYKIIFMTRKESSINKSVERLERHMVELRFHRSLENYYPFDVFRPYDQENIDHVLGICEQRNDIELIQVSFEDIVKEPYEFFTSLNFPIDADKASATVNSKQVRY